MQKTQERFDARQVWSMGWKDPLEEGMATHSSILAKRHGHRSLGIGAWAQEPGGLQSLGSQRVGHMKWLGARGDTLLASSLDFWTSPEPGFLSLLFSIRETVEHCEHCQFSFSGLDKPRAALKGGGEEKRQEETLPVKLGFDWIASSCLEIQSSFELEFAISHILGRQ